MKGRSCWSVLGKMPGAFQALLFHTFVCLAAAAADRPLNDNFADRIVLEGTSVMLSGTIAGATAEADDPPLCCGRSVWWSWKAPESGLALIRSDSYISSGSVFVSTGTNLASVRLAETFVTDMPLGGKRYATFNAIGGTAYQIGVFGFEHSSGGPAAFEIELCLTNLPVILEQPMTRTVSLGASTLFTVAVVANEESPTQIQWQFNGNDLPSENGPMLVFTNVVSESAGEYRALVSGIGATGSTLVRTSAVARLLISQNVRPRLVLRPNETADGTLMLDIVGEPGQSYFMRAFDLLGGGIAGPVGPSAFPYRVYPYSSHHFFSVSIYEPPDPICNLSMHRMYFALERLAADMKKTNGERIDFSEVFTYLNIDRIECSSGGTYTLSAGPSVTCTIAGHVLETQ